MFRFLTAALVAVFLFLGGESQAQQQCGPSATLPQMLMQNYGERPVFTGQTEDGSTVTFYVNDETGTWTIAVSQGPLACLAASGGGAEMKPMGVSL